MVKLFIQSIKLSIKSQIEYKGSFILNGISQLFIFFTYYFMIVALFSKFNNIKGFTVYEVLLCFSIIQFGYSITETFFRGIDKFEDLIIELSSDISQERKNEIRKELFRRGYNAALYE